MLGCAQFGEVCVGEEETPVDEARILCKWYIKAHNYGVEQYLTHNQQQLPLCVGLLCTASAHHITEIIEVTQGES